MSTAIFFSLPFTGHINPALPVIRELVQRGERIFVYASEEFRGKVEYTGAHFRSYGQYDLAEASMVGNPLKVMDLYLKPLPDLMEKCLPEAREIQPDYIIHDAAIPWGAMIAELLQVPAVGSQAVLLIKSKMLLFNPSQAFRMMSFFIEARKEARAIDAVLKTVAQKYQLKPKTGLEAIHYDGDITLAYTSRAFQPMEHLFEENFIFVGPTVEDRGEQIDFPLEQLGDRPLIYISLGTIFNNHPDFYRMCLEAFANTKYQVVLSTGRWVQPEDLGPLPENFLAGQYVPQLQVLSRAALFISHGGMNSAMEAMWYGVPLLLVPAWGDQFWIAQHIEKLGAGKVCLPSRITASRLRSLAEEVLSQPAYAQVSKRIGKSLQAAGGAKKAADAIEDLKLRKNILPGGDIVRQG
ncbi:macrolide family glycosyltransferase [Dictyobacter aurantiacus]|uniref:Glycosyl transferase n=1 Tax=Dictyobacter aurantiacus TaxID=1936993 RepID=A0A401ZLI3_9CHLR|nr:macrolide family glycosyltransferase [Dictyobacter aurantiacus]GCE07680.1 glycosyl transferase [Dictyobacter aurantiacus]